MNQPLLLTFNCNRDTLAGYPQVDFSKDPSRPFRADDVLLGGTRQGQIRWRKVWQYEQFNIRIIDLGGSRRAAS